MLVTGSLPLRRATPWTPTVKSDGSTRFSDPDFGITTAYRATGRAESELGSDTVYRIDPVAGRVRLVADGFGAPISVVFSPHERQVYVSDTRAGFIRVFDVWDDGTLSDGSVFAAAGARAEDRRLSAYRSTSRSSRLP
jgi:gluconolactonase